MKTYTKSEAERMMKEARSDYKSDKGIAAWWQKDGAWHIALPCADPNPEGYATGGFRWTETSYDTRSQAIAAINGEIERATRDHV